MDRVRGENQTVMKRLKELEKGGTQSTHIDDDRNIELVPRESCDREKKELEDTVKQKEERLLRLQQVYQQNRTKYLTIDLIG